MLSMKVAGKKAKVTFDYEAHDADELTLKLDDIVDILGEEEPGWWKGQLGDRIGVFPSNFVEIMDKSEAEQVKDLPAETPSKHFPLSETCTLLRTFWKVTSPGTSNPFPIFWNSAQVPT